MIEIMCKMVFIPKHFFTHKLEMFDALIVIVAWSLDIVLFFDQVVDTAFSLIVFARFWRILRVINGVIVGTKQDADARVRHLKKKVAIMKNQVFDNDSLKVSVDEAMEENMKLTLFK